MRDWEPDRYLQYADERGRPYADLVRRIDLHPDRVVDLGCGPGNLTAGLRSRWPDAEVVGVDSSATMIARAETAATAAGVQFVRADLRTWTPSGAVDAVISNATLQWVPGHRALLPRWLGWLRPGGVLAFSVPGNVDAPSHRLLAETAAQPRFAAWTADLERPAAYDAATYAEDLLRLGCRVDAWETTYLHVLTGPDPVFAWISSTGARPVLQALPEDLRTSFSADYRAALREAYPEQSYGTVLPFRRVFVVATTPGKGGGNQDRKGIMTG